MRKPDVTLNGISMDGLGWLREGINFPAPQPQTNTIIVPGRNSPIRYTEALGRVSYQPRSFDITLSMLGTREKFNQMSEQIVNRFAGRLVNVISSEEPALYCVGTLEITPGYDPLAHKGQLAISSTDGDKGGVSIFQHRDKKDAEAGRGQYRGICGMQREPVPHHKGEI